MKYSFDFSHLPDYILVKTGQFAVVDDFYKLLKDLIDSAKWQTGTPILIDHRDVMAKQLAASAAGRLHDIYEFNAERLGGSKCALLFEVEEDGVGELFAAAEQFSSLRFFCDQESAEDWLLNRL